MASNMSYNTAQNSSNQTNNSITNISKHLTQEELRVIKECRTESFYYRCIPLSTLFGGLAFIAVKNGYTKAHQRFGYYPKVIAAAFLGHVVGRISYGSVLTQRLMSLPNSELGEKLRREKLGKYFQENRDEPLHVTQSSPSAEFRENAPIFDERRPDLSEHSEGMDSYDVVTESLAPYNDDTESSKSPKSSNSYDNLRREHRREYLEKVAEKYRRQTPEPNRPSDNLSAPNDPVPSPPSQSYKPAEPYFNRKKNKYGDVWEE